MTALLEQAAGAPDWGPLRRRWAIFAALLGFTTLAYVQRNAVSVVAIPIMPALGLSQLQIGWLETAFLASYTAGQIPGSWLGGALGVRRALAGCGVVAALALAGFALLPGLLHAAPLFAGLLAAQLVLGLAQAPLFALLTGAVQAWFPRRQWPLAQGMTGAGIGLGGAAAPIAIAGLMARTGWRGALGLMALPGLGLSLSWLWLARDRPSRPADRPAPAQAAALAVDDGATAAPSATRQLLALALSYGLMNVAFYFITWWCLLYLVQVRHFPLMAGGLAASAPPIGGAVGAALGGLGATRLRARLGARAGLQRIPLASLPAACLMLLLGVWAPGGALALAALTLAFGLIESTEACYWAASMEIAQSGPGRLRDGTARSGPAAAARAGAILNTGGNLGGIVATPVAAYLSGSGHWQAPFLLAAAAGLMAAALWWRGYPLSEAPASGRWTRR